MFLARDISRQAAWAAIREALPPRWQVGAVTHDPHEGLWIVTAESRVRGLSTPIRVSGIGHDDLAALRDLNRRLRGAPASTLGNLDEFRRRTRLAYLEGAEDWATRHAEPLTLDELTRVIRRFPEHTRSARSAIRGPS
jgi:hypothetical protein